MQAKPLAWGSILLLLAGMAQAQEPAYDAQRAARDAHRLAEEQRQFRLEDQLYLNDALRARYGWPPVSGTIWYGHAGPRSLRPLAADYAYAYSSERLIGRRGRGLYIERYWTAPQSVFEPWPYVPGDIYGYSFPPQVRQSIGQRQIQTGPNRWESHPVYPEDVEYEPAVSEELPLKPSPSVPDDKPAAKAPRRRAF